MIRSPILLAAILALLSLTLAGCGEASRQDHAPLILAAASMRGALDEAADAWAQEGHERPVISYAATSALARQIDSGASADIFISADEEWMDSVEGAGRIRADTRRDLVGNRLVLVAPADRDPPVALTEEAILGVLGDGRLAMANPEGVPAGKYGRAALQTLGLWPALKDRIARGENVRAALALVERGGAPLGIVYATDAAASDKVRTVAIFPENSHPRIVYPAALLTDAGPQARAFLDFLGSAKGQRILVRHGFSAASAAVP